MPQKASKRAPSAGHIPAPRSERAARVSAGGLPGRNSDALPGGRLALVDDGGATYLPMPPWRFAEYDLANCDGPFRTGREYRRAIDPRRCNYECQYWHWVGLRSGNDPPLWIAPFQWDKGWRPDRPRGSETGVEYSEWVSENIPAIWTHEPTEEIKPEPIRIEGMDAEDVRVAAKLTLTDRQFSVWRRRMGGWSFAEIAREDGRDESTVRETWRAALENLTRACTRVQTCMGPSFVKRGILLLSIFPSVF
jgi:hypothetical protein